MAWRGDLVARLRADATLAGLFGTRIAFFEASRRWGETYPQLVLQEISGERMTSHQGHSGLEQVRVQFDLYAIDSAQLVTGEAALLAEMEADGVIQGSTRFGFGFLEGRSMGTEDLGNQRRVHRLRMDFQFFWCASS